MKTWIPFVPYAIEPADAETTRQAVRISGLTWEQLGELFDVFFEVQDGSRAARTVRNGRGERCCKERLG